MAFWDFIQRQFDPTGYNEGRINDILQQYGFRQPAQADQIQTAQNIYHAQQPQSQQALATQGLQQMAGGFQIPGQGQIAPQDNFQPAYQPPGFTPQMQLAMSAVPGFGGLATGLQSQQGAMERQRQEQQFSTENMTLAQLKTLEQNQKQWGEISPFQQASMDLETKYKDLNQGLLARSADLNDKQFAEQVKQNQRSYELEKQRLAAEQKRIGAAEFENKMKLADRLKSEDINAGISDRLVSAADALATHPGLTAGTGTFGGLASKFSGDAANFRTDLATFRAQALPSALARLKANGATGSTSDKDIEIAIQGVGNLDPNQKPEQFKKNLAIVTKFIKEDAARQESWRLRPRQQTLQPVASHSAPGPAGRAAGRPDITTLK